ncbi:phenylacetic acid degradation protein PaaN [Ornithinimicrobium tianjinense]|uniref:Phenylacetic acid degradation oxidoreductase n=1 Tax=Ornithinimicrobium tianjinense TaxID=1195761 RepID=A0A917F0K9_9MICO|nr:phenylacetic acid degradation protein PaaN [Ornithinimicrobium tianjinense]GGF36467.1 phenylacetic acid degradation oxidoreductase [Ornithinimicrobium tianjinense]
MAETATTHPLLETHRETLEAATTALRERSYYSRYPESPSPRVYGEGSSERGQAAHEATLNSDFAALADQPSTGRTVGSEVSPYGPRLGVRYPELDVAAAVAAAQAALPAWRDAGAEVRAAVCTEIVEQINARSHEMAHAVMHTSGQPFVMSFQAGGPHAQDRALEAITAALEEQRRIPASVTWEKPAKGEPVRMQKDYRVVPRGLALVIGCNTFPTWNAYPGIFASLATGNPVIVKPHPRAVLPLALTVSIARDVLAEAGFDRALVQLAAEDDGGTLAKDLALDPAVKIIDYTGGPGFGHWLETEGAAAGKLVYTEKAGLNSVVVDSTDDLRGMLGNLAFSFSLYSGQMCTAPQNVYVPQEGVETDEGHLSADEFAGRLADAITRFTADDARAVEILGATVNDDVRGRATDVPGLASRLGGEVVLDSRAVSHAVYPDAVVRTPALVAVDAENTDAYTQECFGPVAFVVRTDDTAESLRVFAQTVREHGGMTAAVYSTDEDVLEAARDAAAEAGVALSENLTGPVFVNQTAAFSDLHGTGANPAANAAYADAAFVANRFRVITSRRHV